MFVSKELIHGLDEAPVDAAEDHGHFALASVRIGQQSGKLVRIISRQNLCNRPFPVNGIGNAGHGKAFIDQIAGSHVECEQIHFLRTKQRKAYTSRIIVDYDSLLTW